MADTLDAADMATPYATVSPDEVRDKFKELADDFRKDVLHRREAAAAATQMSSSASSPGIPRPVLETEGGAAESGELVVTDAAGRPLSPIGTVKAGGFMNISKGSFYKTIDRKSKSKASTRSAELGGPTEPDSPTLGESGFGFSTSLDDGWQTDSGLAVSEIDFTGDFDSSSDADTHGATEVNLAADENSAYNWFGAAPAHTGTHGATEIDLTADVYSSFRTTVNSSWLYVLALPREEFPDCVRVTGAMLIPTMSHVPSSNCSYAEAPSTAAPSNEPSYAMVDGFDEGMAAAPRLGPLGGVPPTLPPRNDVALAPLAPIPRAPTAVKTAPTLPDFSTLSPFQQRRKKTLVMRNKPEPEYPPPLDLVALKTATVGAQDSATLASSTTPLADPSPSPKRLPEGQRELAMLGQLYIQRRDAFLAGLYPCMRETAVNLAAHQLLIEVGPVTSARVDTRSILPLFWAQSKGIDKDVSLIQDKLLPAAESKLQLRYVQLLQCLPTHGASVFKVAERVFGKTKTIPRILAVGLRRLMVLDVKTQAVVIT